jgi:hypothetical protein
MPSIPSNSSFKTTFYLFPHTHVFIYKTGGQGIVITKQGVVIAKQGWLSYHVFSSKTMHFCKTGQRVVFIKTRVETCIKGWDWTCHLQILAGDPDRSTVPQVRGRQTGPRSLDHSRDLPRSLRVLRRKQTGTQSIERTKSFYRWAQVGNKLVMEIGTIFLGDFLMAWSKLCQKGCGKVSDPSEIVWHIKWWVKKGFRG